MKVVHEFKGGIFQHRRGNALVIEGSALWNQFLPVRNRLNCASVRHGCYTLVIVDCGVKGWLGSCLVFGNHYRGCLGVTPCSGMANLEVEAVVLDRKRTR